MASLLHLKMLSSLLRVAVRGGWSFAPENVFFTLRVTAYGARGGVSFAFENALFTLRVTAYGARGGWSFAL